MVESAPLLREYAGNGIEGSNPSGSAIAPDQLVDLGRWHFNLYRRLAEGWSIWPRNFPLLFRHVLEARSGEYRPNASRRP